MSGFTALIRVPGDATARAAAPIFSVIETVVLGLTTRISTVSDLRPAGARRMAPAERADQEERDGDDGERNPCRQVPSA